MEILPLTNCTLPDLVKVFNDSFADYLVKVQVTEDSLQLKIDSENIKRDISAGCFHNGTLVGFILNAIHEEKGKVAVYNAATGIVPAFRGLKLPYKMYDTFKPLLREKKVNYGILEVICDNIRAVKLYENLGYTKQRLLKCYSGTISINFSEYNINTQNNIDFIIPEIFWDVQPSWGHDTHSIGRALDDHTIITIKDNDTILGYAIYTQTGRVKQLAVQPKYRRQGIGTALLQYISTDCGCTLSVFNIDEKCNAALDFLSSLGFRHVADQYEMVNYNL